MSKNEFTELLRAAKEKKTFKNSIRLAIVGNASTQHLATAIKGYGALQNLGIEIFDAGFRQEKAQILDFNSELYTFHPDVVFIFWASETLYEEFVALPVEERGFFSETKKNEVEAFYECLKKNGIKVIQNSLSEYTDNILGSYSLKRKDSFIYQLRKLNLLIMDLMGEYENVCPVDFASLSAKIGRDSFFDTKMHVMGGITISLQVMSETAKAVVDVLLAIKGKIKKCIVLDLDNTLWGGVIGDDGIEKIQIGELGIGKAFVAFQKWLLELKNRGILLAVVSKNELETAEKPFREHPEMVLTLDDFVVFIANWESKAENIKRIQEQLNIGMDSLIFIDDSKFEREAVRSQIPEIEVPEMPNDPCNYVPFLVEKNYFETVVFSSEDKNRTKQYKDEAFRKKLESNFASYEDYLKSLKMKGACKPFDSFNVPRIAQLSQRSNQFNLRTVRMTEADVTNIIANDGNSGFYFELKDKLGEYGLIGYVVLEIRDNFLFISNWVMSCRVLKRTMEEFILNHLVAIANKSGIEIIRGEYIPTEKNALVKDLFLNYGFTNIDSNTWELIVDTYEEKKTYVEEDDVNE